MAWLRIDDRLAMSVKVRGLVEEGVRGPRAKAQRNEALGHWLQILSWVAGEGSDGFVTADIVEEYGTDATTARLLRARYGRAPLLHRRDEHGRPASCPCLADRNWPADYDYAVHDYLDRNPSRSENDVHKAKARELRDPKLKAAVAARDGDMCRYCGVATRLADKRGELGRNVRPRRPGDRRRREQPCRRVPRLQPAQGPPHPRAGRDGAPAGPRPHRRGCGLATGFRTVSKPDSERIQVRTQIRSKS